MNSAGHFFRQPVTDDLIEVFIQRLGSLSDIYNGIPNVLLLQNHPLFNVQKGDEASLVRLLARLIRTTKLYSILGYRSFEMKERKQKFYLHTTSEAYCTHSNNEIIRNYTLLSLYT